tara:strand:- start:1198 stop:1866 length:669 start_codon:yes stop_codon:yes gene_type:complete
MSDIEFDENEMYGGEEEDVEEVDGEEEEVEEEGEEVGVDEDEMIEEFDGEGEVEEDDVDDNGQIIVEETKETDDESDSQSDEDNGYETDDTDDGEEEPSQFDEEFKFNYINKIHPEEANDNYNVIREMCKIKRDNTGIIIDENHVTIPILTKYEKTRILGLRLTQLNKGAKPFVETKNKIIDNNIIAQKELKEKKLPFIIMRPLPNGKREYWKLNDLEIIEN